MQLPPEWPYFLGEVTNSWGRSKKSKQQPEAKYPTVSRRFYLEARPLGVCFTKLLKVLRCFFMNKNSPKHSRWPTEKALNKSEKTPWDWNIYLHEWLEFMINVLVNICQSHSARGGHLGCLAPRKCDNFQWTSDNHPPYMGVSKNRGTSKSSILIGFSIMNHPL